MSSLPAIAVLVPTRGNAARRVSLQRAVDSILAQEHVRAVPIVIVNGADSDGEVLRHLRASPALRLAVLNDADLPRALQLGRRMVDTPYFAELDDDDELLPDALANRVRTLTSHPDADVVVTNGIRRNDRGDALHIPNMDAIARDPLRAFLRLNWLLPGSWLCRTDRVKVDLFDGMPRFRECSYLALKFASAHRIVFLDEPTVVYNTDTAPSESKSREYFLSTFAAQSRLLELDLPADVRAHMRRTTLASSCRSIARRYVTERRPIEAWGWYLKSAVQPGGLRYLLRRLFDSGAQP